MDQLKARGIGFDACALVFKKGMDKNTLSNAIKKAFFQGRWLCFSQPTLETTKKQTNFAS
jgi:lambda repressor-like predicted transcriptional regulator